jgi:hypothetical protein
MPTRTTSLILLCALFCISASAQSTPTATLTAASPISGGALGTSVAISGSTVAAGGGGIILVFTKPTSSPWSDMTESAQLKSAGTAIGGVLAINGDGSIIISCAPGGVQVFVKPEGGWHGVIFPTALLVQGAPPKYWVLQGTLHSVAINAKGDTIVAGAFDAGSQGHPSGGKIVEGIKEQGAAYIWSEPAGGWAAANNSPQTAKLVAGVNYDHFGWSVGVSANTIAIGAPANVANGTSDNGSIYLYNRPAKGVWLDATKVRSKFTTSDAAPGTYFGYSVAIADSGALVAASNGAGCNGTDGAAYVFARPGTSWPTGGLNQTAKLTPSDISGADCFLPVSAAGEQITVGAFSALNGAGAAYNFVEPQGGWGNLSLPASLIGGSGSESFGSSVSISGRTTAVGAPWTTENGVSLAGAVYVFTN